MKILQWPITGLNAVREIFSREVFSRPPLVLDRITNKFDAVDLQTDDFALSALFRLFLLSLGDHCHGREYPVLTVNGNMLAIDEIVMGNLWKPSR